MVENTEQLTPKKEKLGFLKQIYKILTEDSIRLQKEKIWAVSEKRIQGYMKPQVDERGADLAHININQSAKSVNYLDQVFFNIIHQSDKLYHINPTGIDDILAAQLIANTLNGKCWQIEDFKFSLLMAYHQNTSYGFTAGKFFSTPEWDLEYINPFNIYIANALSFSKIPAIVQKLTWSKEELKESAKEFNGDEVELNEFIEKGKYEYTTSDVSYDQLSAANIQKKLKTNYTGAEIWYKIDKQWHYAILGCLDIDNGGNIIPVPTFLLSDKKSPLWYGHPYVFGGNIPDLRSLYWTGEPELVGNIQDHLNMFVNCSINYLMDSVRPPLLWEESAIDNSVKLDPLLNPGMGGDVPVLNLQGFKYLSKPAMNPQVFQMFPFLVNLSEQMNALYGALQGEQPAREEPATTTLRRTELAGGGVNFRFNLFFVNFLRTLAQKMMMALFQSPPTEDFIAFGGANEEYIKITKGNDLKAEKMAGQPYFHLVLPQNKKIAEKFTRDIQVAKDIQDRLNQIEQRNLLQYLQILMQMMAAAPELRVGSDMAELLQDIFYQIGGNKSKKYFDADKISQAQAMQMAQGGLGREQMGGGGLTIPEGVGPAGRGAEMRSAIGAGG